MSRHARAFASSASVSRVSAGNSRATVSTATATCSAVGKLLFDDWPMLTWSLGWTGVLPPRVPASASLAMPAITSFAFMFDCVRSEEHTSELQSLMRISYAVFCLKKKTHIFAHYACDLPVRARDYIKQT